MLTALASRPVPVANPAASVTELEAQYAETIDLLWRNFRRLGVPDAVLPDAVQDALLVVHRRRADFRGEATFLTWVYGVLLRVASGYRRSASRAAAVFDRREPLAIDSATSPSPDPFEQLEQHAATELLHRLLDELPDEARAVFVLVELEELTIEAAARALGLRVTTCKSRLRSARRAFDAACARERARHERLEVK